MPIDITSETLISPGDYTKLRPPGRNGKPMHMATFYRHVYQGVRGVRLEHVKLGGQTFTSTEAVQRFVDRLTEARSAQPAAQPRAHGPATTTSTVRTATARQRAHQAADRELERIGA